MDYDFSKPQRQSISGILIMAANNLQKTVRALIIPLAIILVKADTKALSYGIIGLAAITLINLIFSYFSYRKFTFYLDDAKQEFVINKGIFNRTLLTIQLDKIQQVNINQSLLQKLIGVYSLQIDTPGSESKEVSIDAIDEKLAYSLKEHLLDGQKESLNDVVAEENIALQEQAPFLKISLATLFKVGLTSNYRTSLLVLIGFVFTIFHNAKELISAFDTDNGQVEEAIKTGISIFSIGILVAFFLGVLLIINIVRTFIKYFNIEVSTHKLSLLISSGLFAKRNTLLNPKKVQVTSYSQNYFQKRFNIIDINLKPIHSKETDHEKDLHKSNLEIPGCNEVEKNELLKLIFGDISMEGKTFTPNYRFVNLPIFFRVVIPVGIYMVLCAYFAELKPYYPIAIAYFLVVLVMIYFSYRRHRLTVNQHIIIKKSGIWDITRELIVPEKIQKISTFQYPWHKGVDVGHVDLHTAAGIIHFKYGNYTEIKQLVNYWLYQIESGSEEWM